MLLSFFGMFPSFLFCPLSKFNSHWFQDCAQQNLWGNLKIHLFDTRFWSLLSKEPEKFIERFRTKVNLLEYDFAIMPMFEE
jgi:hypothetical protein